MITYKQMDQSCMAFYDEIPMRLIVNSEYKITKINRGLGGFTLTEEKVAPYLKEFDEGVHRWGEMFDLSNWAFFVAFDGDKPIAAATVAARTKNVHMLAGREDMAVLWDIRVHDDYKHQGIGQKLFDMAKEWSKAQGFKQIKIECQNNNVPAVKFYHKQGAVLSEISEYAYYGDPECEKEVQLIWYLTIDD